VAAIPLLPPGREIELPGRGITFYREAVGPPGAPALLLLHGWTATADLNWFRCYGPLARSFRVVALDHRGHGRGIRSAAPFRLDDCADDAAALCETLGIHRAIAVGYSMGGPIAMLAWRRHPELVAGLVLGATAGGFSATTEERRNFLGLAGLAALARVTPPAARNWLAARMIEGRGKAPTPWVMRQLQRHDWTALLEAGAEIGRFDSLAWLGEIDVPVAQLLTENDHVVPLWRQEKLLAGLPAARSWRVHAPHDAVVSAPEEFLPALEDACRWVATEARWGGPDAASAT
jgi:3-oxoadipate enol-lactonase